MVSRAALLPEILDIVTLLAEAQADEDDAAEQARSAGRFETSCLEEERPWPPIRN